MKRFLQLAACIVSVFFIGVGVGLLIQWVVR